MTEPDLDRYFRGEALYGDDFTAEQLEAWYRDEEEGYFQLAAPKDASREKPRYAYHALNRFHGFSHLPDKRLGRALSLGGAYGEELWPILDRVDEVTIVEPGAGFVSRSLQGVPLLYVKPALTGKMAFPDGYFGVALSLGALHHIANVSTVAGELFRCLQPGGYALIREPITSMGDWRKPRKGLTRRERGIPLNCFDRMLDRFGFRVMHRAVCQFSPVNRLGAGLGFLPFRSTAWVAADRLLSLLFTWNYRYHATRSFHKIRPSSVFYVVRKPE